MGVGNSNTRGVAVAGGGGCSGAAGSWTVSPEGQGSGLSPRSIDNLEDKRFVSYLFVLLERVAKEDKGSRQH